MPGMEDLSERATPAQDATMALLAALAPLTRDSWRGLAPDVAALGVVLVNIVLVGTRAGWTLVDAGLPRTADYIRRAAEQRFAPGVRPDARSS
jgi:glyoxylase-like metal-dependent hydrolase (beta-lactamase superfamily II)